MQQDAGKQPKRPALRLGFDRDEWQYLSGAGNAAMARTIGLFLATVVGSGIAGIALDSIWRGEPGYWRVAVGLIFLFFGLLVHAGVRWASVALIGLFTADRVYGFLFAYMHRDPSYIAHPRLWLCEGTLAWATWTCVFAIGLRAERKQLASAITTNE